MKLITKLAIGCLLTWNISCSKEDATDAANSLQAGGPSAETATEIDFISDVSWLKDNFGQLDQASIPWVWGTFLLLEEIGGVSGIPVLFDYDNPPELTADIKIEVAGSEQLNNRPPLTIFDGKKVALKLGRFTAMLSLGDDSAEYDKIPDSIPLVGGKTIYPLYFIVPMTSYDWATAGEDSKKSFEDALNKGDLGDKKEETSSDIPVPWLDCETVKITIKFKGSDSATGIVNEKYLAADPAVTKKLLENLSDEFSPTVEEATGMKLDMLKQALDGIDTPGCEAPDDADIALFN